MNNIYIRRAELEDISTIAKLAEKIWKEYYPSVISYAQIEYMLFKMYSPDSLYRQIEQLSHQYFLMYADDQAIGYYSVEPRPGECFIHKFYIDASIHGKGIGSILMEHLLTTHTCDSYLLQVNRKNIKAINFYFRHGFRIKKWEDIDIGGGFYMEDFIMERK